MPEHKTQTKLYEKPHSRSPKENNAARKKLQEEGGDGRSGKTHSFQAFWFYRAVPCGARNHPEEDRQDFPII
jgi:hypothetical protein